MVHHKHLNVYAPESETERGPERSCNQHTKDLISAQKAQKSVTQNTTKTRVSYGNSYLAYEF